MPGIDTPQVVPVQLGPIVNKGPITSSAPLNIGLGTAAIAVANYGVSWVTEDKWSSGIALVLNVIMQPAKKMLPFLSHYEWACLFMFIVAAALLYFFVFPGDVAQALVKGGGAVIDAIGNYKGDKASGFNIMKPAVDD